MKSALSRLEIKGARYEAFHAGAIPSLHHSHLPPDGRLYLEPVVLLRAQHRDFSASIHHCLQGAPLHLDPDRKRRRGAQLSYRDALISLTSAPVSTIASEGLPCTSIWTVNAVGGHNCPTVMQ